MSCRPNYPGPQTLMGFLDNAKWESAMVEDIVAFDEVERKPNFVA